MQKSILVVEDEPAIQKILQEPLAAAGYRVAVASDGLQGITAFCAGAFDLVILDILLPKMDGYAVCRRIRQQSGVPILLLTALDAEDDQIRGFDLLADDYITKPFSVRLVLKRVEALLRRARPPQGAQAPCGEAPSLQGAQAPCGGTRPPQGAAGSPQGAQTPRGGAGQAAGVIRRNGIALDEAGRQVFAAEKEVPLTYLEFEILRLLLKIRGGSSRGTTCSIWCGVTPAWPTKKASTSTS